MADKKNNVCNNDSNPRRVALDVLLRCSGMSADGDGYSNILTDSAIRKSNLDERNRALMTRLVFGVIERRITLDYIISKLSSRPLEKLDDDVKNILRLGIYQLRYSDKIPEHAAVNETVALAKQSCRGFVNAILRSYLRGKDSLEFPSKDKNIKKYLSVTYSVSEKICSEFLNIYGAEKTERILAAMLEEPPITLRTNTLKCSRQELIDMLSLEGFEAVLTEYSPFGVKILNKSGLPDTFEKGFAFVQDEASQICAAALDPKSGDKVIDVCACPGSKSFSAAICMGNKGSVLSCDIHSSKLSLVKKGAEKLGIDIIETVRRDALQKEASMCGKYDCVICDVPCSGFGVMAKKPEIRYKSLEEARKLPATQYGILEASAELLKIGGHIVYSTCTILPAENEQNVEKFLQNNKNFILVPFECGTLKCDSGMITLTPDGGTDGFFIAKLERIS